MSHSVLYVYVSEDRKIGIHGYTHGTMTSARFAKAPYLITPIGYKPKLNGNQLKDHDYNPKYGGVDAKGPIIKPEDSGLTFIDAWSDTGDLEALLAELPSDCTVYYYGLRNLNIAEKPVTWTSASSAKVTVTKEDDKVIWRGEDIKYIGYCRRNALLEGTRCILTDFATTEYWDADKSVPSILTHKWSYTLTNELGTVIEGFDNNLYHEYFLGDHAKSNDELEVLGKEDPETGFALVWTKEACDILDEISKYHAEHLWDGRRRYERYEVISMVNINNLMMPGVQFETRVFGTDALRKTEYNTRLETSDGTLVSMAIVPPKISYRVLDIRNDLRSLLDSYLGSSRRALMLTDVTDKFIQDGKLTGLYGQTTNMLEFVPNNHVGDTRAVQYLAGIDFPLRRVFNDAPKDIVKIQLVTWPFSEKIYHYGMIIETKSAIGIWTAGYSGKMFCF